MTDTHMYLFGIGSGLLVFTLVICCAYWVHPNNVERLRGPEQGIYAQAII